MKVYLVIIILLFSIKGFGQSTNDSIKHVINNFFTAMNKSDSNALKKTLNDNALLQTITTKQGKVEVKNESIIAFIHSISKLPVGAADERITFKSIMTDGDLASAWTPYEFFYKGNFSHCGVNSFQLVRIDGNWKIQYIIDTRRKTNCTD